MDIDRLLENLHKGLCEQGGCGGQIAMIIVLLLFLLCGCSSTKEFETESHSYSKMTAMFDSLMRSTHIWQNDFLSRQTSLIEKLSQKEKNDSLHTVTLNENGDTIKERIVIYKEVSTEHSSEQKEMELLISQYNRIDSMLKVSVEKQAETDSLLREKENVKEVPAKLSWWQSLRLWLGNITLCSLLALIGYGVFRMWKVYKFP